MLSDSDDDGDLLLSDYLGRSTRSKTKKRGAPSNNADDDGSDDDDDGDFPRSYASRSNKAGDKTQKQRQKTDLMVQSVMEGVRAAQERKIRAEELRRQEIENENLDKAQQARAAQRESDEAAMGHVDGQPSLQDRVSGLTVLYRDYTVFDDKDVLKKRVRGMEDAGYVCFGGRPGLLVQQRLVVAAVDGDRGHDESRKEEPFEAFKSYEDAIGVLRRDLPDVAATLEEPEGIPMEMTERIRFILEDQLFPVSSIAHSKTGGSETKAIDQALASWLYRAAITGSGKHSYCPLLEELSSVALELLMRLDDTSLGMTGPSLVAFHAVMNRYGPGPSSTTASSTTTLTATAGASNGYMNILGFEYALTYWSFDRIMSSAVDEGTDSMKMASISTLSLILLDDSLERLHPLALESMLALVLLRVGKSRAGSDSCLPVLEEVAQMIFHNLPETLGSPPRTVKYVDDDQASLATSQLLAGLLPLSAHQDRTVGGWDAAIVTKCVRQFQNLCARAALSRLNVSVGHLGGDIGEKLHGDHQPPPSSPEPSTLARTPNSETPDSAGSVPSSPIDSSPGLLTVRPEGVNEEVWHAFLAVIEALQNAPRDKKSDVRSLAVLHSIYSLLRTALQWLRLPASSGPTAGATPSEAEGHQSAAAAPVTDCGFGTEVQAKAWLTVLERLSNELANLGKFLGWFPRNEYFRHADLLLQVVTAYVEQTARPLCAQQAGASFRPIQLKQKDIRKYFS